MDSPKWSQVQLADGTIGRATEGRADGYFAEPIAVDKASFAPGPTDMSTSTPTPTPTPYQTLLLTSICSANPAHFRVWRVRNNNPYPAQFTRDVYGTAQTGSGTAPIASVSTPVDVFFQITLVGGANTTRIFVNGLLNNTQASGAQC